jgi:Fe2+ or Zn2+ uptake regulation protein
MIDYRSYTDAVALVRAAGLIPTHTRLCVARLVLEAQAPASLDDLADEAADAGLGLSRESLARTLALLTQGGAERRT